MSWSDAEDRREHELLSDRTLSPLCPAGQGESEPVAATLDAELDTAEEE